MTLTIGGIPGSGASYYTGSTYYKDSVEHSLWGGGAKEALGLGDGPVNGEQLDMLFEGHVPDGNRIAKPINGKWVSDPGRDFTFSAPKSVSILAQGPLKEKIHASMMRAADKAMQYGEKEFAATRITNKETGVREIVGDQKIIYALFLEETSRADDPQLHVHGPAPNLALGQDGKFRALCNEGLYNNQIILGQAFRAELAKDLKQMGFEIEKTGKHGQFEIKHVDPKVKEALSKRRKDMLAKAGPDNQSPKRMQAINLITRAHKSNASPSELMPRWRGELKSLGTSFKEITATALTPQNTITKNEPVLSSVVNSNINHMAETQRSFGKYALLRSIMGETYGHFTIDKVQAEIDKQRDNGLIKQSKDGKHYALAKTLRREKEAIDQMHIGHLQSKPIFDRQIAIDKVSGGNLTSGQTNGAALILSSRHRFVGLQGTAGTGKTTMLKTALPLTQHEGINSIKSALPFAKEKGFKLIGIAPTGAATQELADTRKFDKTITLQQYLLTPEGDRKTMLVVDESSMVSTDQMLSLMRYANKAGMAKVVLMGDTRQMGSVAAGTPFQDLQKAGLRTARLNEVVRQSNPRHRKAVEQLAIGNIKEGFKNLSPEIHETAKTNLESLAAQHWHDLKDIKAPIIVQTNRQKETINGLIKEGLKRDANSPEINHTVYKPMHMTDEKKKFVSNYEGATHIRFNRTYKNHGIQAGDILKVQTINQDRANIILEKGRRLIKFRPATDASGKGATEVYQARDISLQKDDRIRFTRGTPSTTVNNNDFGVIKSVTDDNITITLDKGKERTFKTSDLATRYIDHAWANTAHAFQGKTVDHAIVVMPSDKSALTTLNSLYTGASRHKTSVAIITDDKARLQKNLTSALKTQASLDKLFRGDHAERVSSKKQPDSSKQKDLGIELGDSHKRSKVTDRSVPSRGDYGR